MDVGRIALAGRSTLNIDIRHLQVREFTVKKDRSRGCHHYGETRQITPGSPQWRHYTNIISILN
jgi:hypothetical protein